MKPVTTDCGSDPLLMLTKHVCDKCGSSYVGKECDQCKKYKENIDYIMEQIRNLTPKQPRSNASDLVDAATYGYRYVSHYWPGGVYEKLKQFDCNGFAFYDNEPVFLNKKLNIPEYKGEMNMKNVSIEEKQTLRICRESNEWRDIYTVADTEPTDLFVLCGDQSMRVYMRVAMDEDTFLIKDPKMVPVMDVKTGHIDMMDTDEKIFIYDPVNCNLDVGYFMHNKSHDDRY